MGAMLSVFCRQMRHTACVARGFTTETCGCTCHYDDEMAGAAEAAAELARNGSAVDQRDPKYVYCEVEGCDPERRFISEHALSIHKARAHKRAAPLIARVLTNDPDPDQEEEVLDEFDQVLEDPEVEDVWSPIVQDALAAIAFLEGRDQNDVIHTVMDDWAGRMRTEPDIGDAIRLRIAYREGQLR